MAGIMWRVLTGTEPDGDVVHGRPVVKDGRNLKVHGHDDDGEQDTSHLCTASTHLSSWRVRRAHVRSLQGFLLTAVAARARMQTIYKD